MKVLFSCSPALAGKRYERSDWIQVSQQPTWGDDCRILLTISIPYDSHGNVASWVNYHTGDYRRVFSFELKVYQMIIYEISVGLAPENGVEEIFEEVNEWKSNFELCGVEFEYFFWNLESTKFGYDIEPTIIESFTRG